MSEIHLTFEEYQEIRGAMAFSSGNLMCYARGDTPACPEGNEMLVAALELLEKARWRTEERAESERNRLQ